MPAKPPPTTQDEIIEQVVQLNKDLHRLSNELNRVHLRWTFIMTHLKMGKSLDETIQALTMLSNQTHQHLYRAIALLEEGATLQEALEAIRDDR